MVYIFSVCCASVILFLAPSFLKHLLNNLHNLCPARVLLPGLDNFDSSLENQCSDRTESEPEGEREGYRLSEVKEKVARRCRERRREIKMLGELKREGEKHRGEEERREEKNNTAEIWPL